jgi:hypothetical protein
MGDRDFLEGKLGGNGLNAVKKLCKLGCERSRLSDLFEWLSSYKPVTIRSVSKALHPVEGDPGEKEHDVEIRVQILDLPRGISLEELRRIARRAKRLQQDVVKLRKLPMVQAFVEEGFIPNRDLLASSPFRLQVHDGSVPFAGLLRLPQLAEQCGLQKRPDYTRRRIEVHKYLQQCTGSWNDSLFVAIFNDLFPGDQETAKDTQRWRSRHGLTRNPH